MKKRIIALILCVLCVMSNCLMIFASSDSFVATGGAHSNGLNSVSSAWEFCKTYQNGNIDNCSYVAYYVSVGNRYALKFYVFPSDCILVRNNSDDSIYTWYVYKYDGSKMVQQSYVGDISYESNYISCYDTNKYYYNTVNTYGCVFDNATSGYEVMKGVPIATSVENALLYYQTMDASYLENAEDFIEVPTPKNVSLYKASDENALYVYYENENFIYQDKTTTRLFGTYRYRDATGSDVNISNISQVDVDYVNRGQIKVDLSILDEYDTGNVVVFLTNCYDNSIDSDWLALEWRKGNNSYYIWDVIDGEVSNLREVVITDYGSKNNSYTGGNNNDIISSIPSASQGDYSFLGGIFNGFGLLGNNGLIALLGHTFSYIPSEIFTLLALGVSAMLIIALFKLLVH